MASKRTTWLAGSAWVLLTNTSLAADAPPDDFPTLARVEYVLDCMNKRGGENYDNLYGCVCAIDYIRSRFSYDEYNEASTFRTLRESGGERSAIFRDPPRASELRKKLAEVDKAAETQCYLKSPSQSKN